jgi:hypothetical protein
MGWTTYKEMLIKCGIKGFISIFINYICTAKIGITKPFPFTSIMNGVTKSIQTWGESNKSKDLIISFNGTVYEGEKG